jgi:hypothetical protein
MEYTGRVEELVKVIISGDEQFPLDFKWMHDIPAR